MSTEDTGPAAIEALLTESIESADERTAEAMSRARAGRSKLVLRGAGGMGRDMAAALRAAGEEPACFCDDGLAGSTIEGLQVLTTEEAIRAHAHDAAFVVTVMNAWVNTVEVVEELRALGAEVVCTWLDVAWSHPGGLLPRYAAGLPQATLAAAPDVYAARALFTDQRSLDEFDRQVRWRLTGDYSAFGAPSTQGHQYFDPDLVTLTESDVVYDGGAFDGDTLRWLAVHAPGGVQAVVSFEPDPHNLVQLRKTAAEMDNVTVLPYALGERRALARWNAMGTGASGLSESGTHEVEVASIDELVAAGSPAPSLIKMDIEGAEPEALRGAAATIAEYRPVLAICVYHTPEHLWEIPLQMAEMVDDYSFHLRRYEHESFEVVLYGIPR